MSKFDRCIFISIAVGIWALAMTQVFKPASVNAVKLDLLRAYSDQETHTHSFDEIDDFASGVQMYESSSHDHDHDRDYAEYWHSH